SFPTRRSSDLPPRPRKPRGHRPLVEAKGHHDGLPGTPMGQQSEHQANRLRWRAQAVKGGPLGQGEGLVALRTAQALFLARMNTKVALTGLTSGRALGIGAK